MSVLVVGSVAFDTIKTPSGTSPDVLGGSATYFAYAASLFGPVRILSAIGSDFPARQIRKMQRRHIDTAGLKTYPGKTFRWTGEYGANLKEAKTLSVSLNVLGDFVPDLPKHYRDSRFVFLANIDPEIQAQTLRQVKSPELVVCDTMNHWLNTKLGAFRKLLKKIDVLLLNDEEARMFTGENNLVNASRAICRMGPRAVVVKKGEHGAILAAGAKKLFLVPAYPTVKVVDPTGAGDSFGGGFIGCLAASGDLSEAGLRRAVVYGTVVASFTVEDVSLAALENVNRRAVEKRVSELRGITEF